MEKEGIQESQYEFPYHYIPYLSGGFFSQSRILSWGYEYLSYIRKVVGIIEQRGFSSLVDVGCGDGRLLAELAAQFPNKRLVGTDFSEKALALGRAFAPSVEFRRDIGEEMFDAWTLIEVLEHIPPDEIDSFLSTLSSCTRPGGFGVVTVPSTNMPLHRKHYQHFSDISLRATLENHFRVETISYLNAQTFGTRFMQRLLTNKVFAIQYPPLLSWWYRTYETHHIDATPATGKRVMAVVQKI